MRVLLLAVLLAGSASAQTLAGTQPLQLQGDPAREMVEGISGWLIDQTNAGVAQRKPTRDRLRAILGITDPRTPFSEIDLAGTTAHPALLAENAAFRVYSVRWPVLDGMTAEGLLFQPRGKTMARVVALPDADQLPERLPIAQTLAASGCEVLSPVLIDRSDTWSGNPRIRMTNQPHREFVYRMAFVTGRTIWGYETQKALAAVDWFAAREPKLPIGIWGYGEGGAEALFAAALDDRIAAAGISGYLEPRENLWKQPIFRNVFGLLKDFGDAELIAMAAPRAVVVDTTPGPSWNGNPETAARRGAAPGSLIQASPDAVAREAERARALNKAVRVEVSSDGAGPFLRGLGAQRGASAELEIPVRDADARQRRQFDEMVEFTERLLRLSQKVRDGLWSKADGIHDIDQWKAMAPALRSTLWNDVIGRLPSSGLPLNVRTRRSYGGAKWDGYEVVYDVLPGVFGYGVLLMPKDIRAGERRPVVVAQHGLEGRPQDLFGQDTQDRANGAYTKFHFYQNIGSTMADLGYIVYLPQNPYIGDFRKINRLANPMGWSLFSFVLLQNERLLDWLDSMPEVDPARIGFYGLSYGGKTALRIPTLLDRYALSICSGDFNEWVDKLTSVDEPISYMFSNEYEMFEWNLAGVANHGEMAKLMAPRPFMVERGHRDTVGIDEWVSYEYVKVRRFYDELGIGDRTEIEYFNGPHMMHAVGTVAFLRKHLGR